MHDFEKWREYCEIAFALAFLTALIRPFISLWQKIREMVLTVIGAILVGWLVDDLSVGQFAKDAAVGLGGLFAVRLFEVIDAFLLAIKQDPIGFFDKVRK